MTKTTVFLLLCCVALSAGCASLQSGYETPSVGISSFEAVPSNNMLPQFKIGLHIVNPNRSVLVLKGVSYTISLEGHKVLTGVSNKPIEIEPYGQGNVQLIASIDVFSSIGFVRDLLTSNKKETISYTFSAKLDTGSLHPLIRVKHTGTFSLVNPSKETGLISKPHILSEKRKTITNQALSSIGTSYKWGGASPADGFDCSGLVVYSYLAADVQVPRTARKQLSEGHRILKKELQSADLVFFNTATKSSGIHVGVYIGNGIFVHSPGKGKRVSRTRLDNPYFNARFIGARTYLASKF